MHTESLERRKKAEQELRQARSQCSEAEATIARLKLDIVNNYCTFGMLHILLCLDSSPPTHCYMMDL